MLDNVSINAVIKIAKDTGKAIMQIYNQDFDIEYKDDKSPLTLADKTAHLLIIQGLKKLPVDYPILSEEGKNIPYEIRKNWRYFWLIDPLDGTKEFIKNRDEFSINIALIHQGKPVLGVVYAPALDECYWAKQGAGAFKDGVKLPLKTQKSTKTYKIIASRSHLSDETKTFIKAIKTNREKKLITIGSSLKICLVATGEADIYPRLSSTMEWDTAAAHVIVLEAGKEILQFNNKKPIIYNKENLLNPWFVVNLEAS